MLIERDHRVWRGMYVTNDISIPIHVDMQVYKNKEEKRPNYPSGSGL